MGPKGKVLLAMSGGIDSSLSAVLLHEQGYEVIGITMKTWDYASSNVSGKETGCCSLDSIHDARALAVSLGIPHYILDIRDEFGNFVVDNFVDEYMSGRTPNPCVLCNTHIKWEALLKRADMLGCEWIATGHYARIRKENGRYIVSKGLDANKDQSYVLWGLKQECLARTLFPIGSYQKTEIRRMAMERGFHELVTKSESYEICFVPDNDYRAFLKNKIPGLEGKLKGGDFVDRKGNVLGQHKGYPFYTIGQRKGLEIAVGSPLYVIQILPETNTVVLGEVEDLLKDYMYVSGLNLMKYPSMDAPIEVLTKIRYKDPGTLSRISREENKFRVDFFAPASAVAPGQSAVFYEGDDLVGGGIISAFNRGETIASPGNKIPEPLVNNPQ